MDKVKTTKICGWILFVTGIVLVLAMVFAVMGGARAWLPMGMGIVFILMGWRMKTTGKM